MARPGTLQRRATQTPEVRAPRFIGRDAECRRLQACLEHRPSLVLIEGEAGAGKSRLVREALKTGVIPDSSTLVAACPPFSRSGMLTAVVEPLRRRAQHVRALQLSSLCGALRPVFSEWAEWLPPPLEDGGDLRPQRQDIFSALIEVLEGLGVRVLIVEDLHWADEVTVEFLLSLMSGGSSISVIATYRVEEMPDDGVWRRLLALSPGDRARLRLKLGALDQVQTAGLASSMLGDVLLPGRVAELLHARTEGLPLAIEECVRLLTDRAEVECAIRQPDHGADPWDVGGWLDCDVADVGVPATIRDSVLERVRRLSRDAQAAIRAAAVLDEPADDQILGRVAGLDGEFLRGALVMAIGHGLIEEGPDGLLSFRHVLTQQAVYESIPGPERRRLHYGVGTALEGAFPTPLRRLAHHFELARDLKTWPRYAELAADGALAAGDEVSAANLVTPLILGAQLPALEVARLVSKFPCTTLFGDRVWRDQGSTCSDLVDKLHATVEAPELGAEVRAVARYKLAGILLTLGEYKQAGRELEACVDGLPKRSAERAHAMIHLGYPADAGYPASACAGWLRDADSMHVQERHASQSIAMAVDRATALLALGDSNGWGDLQRIPEGMGSPGERLLLANIALNWGDMAMVWGRYREARSRLVRALTLARECHNARVEGFVLRTQAHLDWFTGAWERLDDPASERHRGGGTDVSAAEAALVRGLWLAAHGETAAARDLLRLCLERARNHGPATYLMEPAAALTRLALRDSDVSEALSVSDEPSMVLSGMGIWLWGADLVPARAEALVAAGRAHEAASLVDSFEGGLAGIDAPAPRAALLRCKAAIFEAKGEYSRGIELYGRVATAWDQLPRPYEAALARACRGRCMLTLSPSDPAALRATRDAHAALVRLGAVSDADRVALLAARVSDMSGDAFGGRGRGYGDQLSPRETEVVRLVMQGQTDRQIARALSRSPRTVETQMRSAMRKLKAPNRTALAVRAIEAGLVDGPESAAPKR